MSGAFAQAFDAVWDMTGWGVYSSTAGVTAQAGRRTNSSMRWNAKRGHWQVYKLHLQQKEIGF